MIKKVEIKCFVCSEIISKNSNYSDIKITGGFGTPATRQVCEKCSDKFEQISRIEE